MSEAEDVAAIRALIERQFASLNWCADKTAAWGVFAEDFHPDASLFPSARPAECQSVEAFVRRMQGLAAGDLETFHETALGVDVRVFGNIAVATAACEIIENDKTTSRSVEMMLLVKSEGAWKIAAQAWDRESAANPVPPDLLRR